MKVFEKIVVDQFDYPEDMEKILAYLSSVGDIKVCPKQIEKLYRDFSDMDGAGWLSINEEEYTLEMFANWLEDQEI